MPIDDAISHVLGYSCANDVSARWWQREGSGGQFCRGKSFDTFCPLGPEVTPAEEIPDPQNLRIRCRVNGETMQDANTSAMIFPVAELISELSRGATLMPGTVLVTGSPSGVGFARSPQVFLGFAFNWGAMRRHHDGFKRMRDAIVAGEIGDPRYATMYSYTDIIKHHPHTLDLVAMLLGDPAPRWVEGRLADPDSLLARACSTSAAGTSTTSCR